MGGGAMWRGVAKLLPPAAKVVVAASASTSCAACRLNTSSQASSQSTLKAQATGSSRCFCDTETTAKSSKSWSWDADDWEFAEGDPMVGHLVFGSLPSRKEVEEATSELRDALRLGIVVPASNPREPSSDESAAGVVQGDQSETSSVMSGKEEESSSPSVSSRTPKDWLEPPPVSSDQRVLEIGGRNVVEAFHQFQHNPEVQNMVVSIATDQAVWDAVLSNEKIQEYKRRVEGGKGFFADRDSGDAYSKGSHDGMEGKSQNIWEMMSSFLGSIWIKVAAFFKSIDKVFLGEESGDIADKTIKACTMLAFIVICVVILKRGPRAA